MTCLTFLFMIALKNKTVVHTFVHRSTVQMIDRLGQENIVESQKFFYHGNVTSHFSSLLPCCLVARSIE